MWWPQIVPCSSIFVALEACHDLKRHCELAAPLLTPLALARPDVGSGLWCDRQCSVRAARVDGTDPWWDKGTAANMKSVHSVEELTTELVCTRFLPPATVLATRNPAAQHSPPLLTPCPRTERSPSAQNLSRYFPQVQLAQQVSSASVIPLNQGPPEVAAPVCERHETCKACPIFECPIFELAQWPSLAPFQDQDTAEAWGPLACTRLRTSLPCS